jgi:hypothetical protein
LQALETPDLAYTFGSIADPNTAIHSAHKRKPIAAFVIVGRGTVVIVGRGTVVVVARPEAVGDYRAVSAVMFPVPALPVTSPALPVASTASLPMALAGLHVSLAAALRSATTIAAPDKAAAA